MSPFSDRTVELWQKQAERQLNLNSALAKLWELRDDPVEDTSLFLMQQKEMTDAETGDHFTVKDTVYKVEHIEYDFLFVRQL